MKTKLLPFAVLAALLITPLRSRAEVTIDVFYDSLDPYGDWMEVADYGYCWQPRDVSAEWRPYTLGEWVYTDAGWTWLSEEPFGWATYHYGRWLRLESRGWVWVPDTQWGPAWVSWRDSDRYVGWAPLPPETRRVVDVGLGSWVDSYFDVGPTAYTFVELRHFGSPRIADVVLAPRDNVTIVRETRNVTNVKVLNNVVVNYGPDYGAVARAADRPIRKLRLERQNADPTNARTDFRSRIEGETVKVVAPRITGQPSAKPRRVAPQVQAPQIDRGWREAGPADQTEALRAKLKAEAKAPDQLPPRTDRQGAQKKSPRDATADRPAAKNPPPPVAEQPTPDAPPPVRRPQPRTESRPPTPEPQPFRESKPDGVAKPPKPTPSVIQPPGAEQPRVDPPRREIDRPDRERMPRQPNATPMPDRPKRVPQRPVAPPEERVRPPAAERPETSQRPAPPARPEARPERSQRSERPEPPARRDLPKEPKPEKEKEGKREKGDR